MEFSITIATFDRGEVLRACMTESRLTFFESTVEHEVIVTNNARRVFSLLL